jgi:hypothetical protein
MPYYPDLTENTSSKKIRIGWLSREYPFANGSTSPRFLDKLRLCYQRRVKQTRGFQVCPFCEERRIGLPVEIDGKIITLGSAEIEVTDEKGRTYAAPDLLYHYITEHHYLPPEEFIEAVCRQALSSLRLTTDN